MRFVQDWREISMNIQTLAKGVMSGDASERAEYHDLVLRGICFVVADIRGQVVFAPSRFIGYAENTAVLHQQFEGKDGRDTNPVLAGILGEKWQTDSDLDLLYQQYCLTLGLEPRKAGTYNKQRKFIDMRKRLVV